MLIVTNTYIYSVTSTAGRGLGLEKELHFILYTGRDNSRGQMDNFIRTMSSKSDVANALLSVSRQKDGAGLTTLNPN